MSEEKKEFIRKEIVEKGYKEEDFKRFLIEKKNGADLESLSFDEVKTVK